MAMKGNILEVNNLKKYFKTKHGMLHAVDDVSFTLEYNKTLGIVGESGCGKTTIGRTILRLIEPTAGEIIFEGQNILKLNKEEMRKKRKDMQIIFQDPYSSLDPRKSVSQTIMEPIVLNKLIRDKKAINMRILEIMEMVGLAERLVNSFPHELDGGRRQRIGIARALAMEPKLIICDEPVSSLDVSIQAQILNLLKELQENLGLSFIFITHDLSVVNHFSDDIAVMYLGQLVEMAPVGELFLNPLHPYTQALLKAIPVPEVSFEKEKRTVIKGELTSPINPPDQCRFSKRCIYADEKCLKGSPLLHEVKKDHFVACYKEVV